MFWIDWILFACTEAALCLVPGPAVLYVTSRALRCGRAPARWAVLAIVAGNLIYFGLSATGLGALLAASPGAFLALKWAGAAYLVYLGVAAMTGRAPAIEAAGGPARAALPTSRRLFLDGLVVQLANPKALLFFTAFLPPFIDPTHAILPQIAILAATSVTIEFAILSGYACLASYAGRLSRHPRLARLANGAAGSLLIAAGASLALLRR